MTIVESLPDNFFDRDGLSSGEMFTMLRSTDIPPEKKRSVLFREGDLPLAQIDDVARFCRDNIELQRDAKIDLHKRYPSLQQDVQSRTSPDLWDDKRDYTVERLATMNFGARIINGTMIAATHPVESGDFGNIAREAINGYKYPAHNFLHVRILEAIQNVCVILAGTDLKDPSGLLGVASAMLPALHDLPQLLAEQRADKESANMDLKEFNPKITHCEEAAVFVHVLRPIIQNESHLNDDQTDQLIAILSAMVATHDSANPSKDIPEWFTGGTKQKAIEFGDSVSLLFAYEHKQVDLLSFSGSDWYRLLRSKQVRESENKFDIRIYGTLGLGPEFEARFANDIDRVMQDTHVVDWSKSTVTKEDVLQWALLFNIVDTYDMSIPGNYALNRKLEVLKYSLNRALCHVVTDAAETLDGSEEMKKKTKKWNKSEWQRTMRELIELAELMKKWPFPDNKALTLEMFTNTILYNLYISQRSFEKLVLGDVGLESIDDFLDQRVMDIAKKAIRKSFAGLGFLASDRKAQMQHDHKVNNGYMPAVVLRDLVIRVLEDKDPDSKYLPRFIARLNIIARELRDVKNIVRRKPGSDGMSNVQTNGKAAEYSDSARELLHKNFWAIWSHVCEILDVETGRQDQFIIDMQHLPLEEFAKKWHMVPNPGHDPLGDMSDARTVNVVSKEVRNGLDRPPYDVQFDWSSLHMAERVNEWLVLRLFPQQI